MNKNPKRVAAISERAMRVLRTKLRTEYELYDFVQQRLSKQHQQVAPLLQLTSPLPPTKGPKKELSAWDRFQIEMKY